MFSQKVDKSFCPQCYEKSSLIFGVIKLKILSMELFQFFVT